VAQTGSRAAGTAMKNFDFKSISADELWALHEKIASILFAKMKNGCREAQARKSARTNHKRQNFG
jgi:hypothetical protein